MDSDGLLGRTLKVSNIPLDMDRSLLRAEMMTHGTIQRWAAPTGAKHVYAVYETKEMAYRALMALKEHRRIIAQLAYLSG